MSPLRAISAAAAAVLVAGVTAGAASASVEPGQQSGAKVVKTGWWWAANETPAEQPLAAPPQPSSPNVPQGALPVAAAAGDPEKITALEFSLSSRPGSLVESAVLVLREAEDPKANVNQDAAAVIACPVTDSFWSDGAGGAWKTRPAYDCDLAQAAGERDDKGIWTFDLTALASTWLADDAASASVVLVEAVDAPTSFQVAYDGPAAEGVGLAVVTSSAPAKAGPLPSVDTGSVSTAGPASLTGSGGGGLSGSTGAAPDLGSAVVAPPPAQVATGDVAAAAAAPAAAPETTAVTAPVAAPVALPPWYSGLPAGGLLLLPFALALAYLAMLALGPDAQPTLASANRHGVGRALERLRREGAKGAGKVTT